MADDVSITVRVRDATNAGIAAVNRSLDRLAASSQGADKSFGSLKSTAMTFAPALIPIASSAAPIAAAVGAAAVAVGAFGAALGPQMKSLTAAAEAQKAYTDAVGQYGPASAKATAAESAYLASVVSLPPATREAAAAMGLMKDAYQDWSDSLSDDTMPVVTKGVGVLGALFPKMTPLVKGASTELNRFMTIVGGEVSSPGLDKFMDSVGDFATGSMDKANTALVRFLRTLDTGKVSGGVSEFMKFAREQGPVVGDTLTNLAEAVMKLVVASADTGVGMLTLVNALSQIVAAVPPELLTRLMQMAIALKAVKLAGAGWDSVGAAMVAVRAQITAAGTAALGAGSRMGALSLAFGALSKAAKLAVAGTALGLLVLAITQLSQMGKSAPPDVDRLTTSLGKLGQSGRVSGEAARAFGSDLSGLADSLRDLSRPANYDRFEKFMAGLIGMDSATMRDAKADLDSVDKALANLVKGGKTELARAAFDQIAAAMQKQGMSTGELRGKLDDYQASLADVAFEQKLAAQAQGLFGAQAQEVQAKLDAQKQSTDGLRQSIQALNDVNRQGLDGMIGFEAAIDAAAESAKKNADSLSVTGGQLNLNSEKARDAASALNDLAAKTDAATASARESGASWQTVNGIYDRGREKLIAAARAMGLNKEQAAALAAQILKTPDKTARLRGNLEDLKAKLADAKARLARAPSSKTTKIKGEISDLQRKVNAAKSAIAGVHGKTVSVMVQYRESHNPSSFAASIGGYAHGGITGAAGGGPRSRRTLVGEHGPEIVDLAPGSRVRSNPDTKRMLAGGTAGGGQPMVVQLMLDGRQLAEVMVDPLRGVVQARGGSVQAVLGQAGR
ncbi:hypothetical protein ACWCPT_05715 [Streptomyces sp. NPDC002308]